MHRDENNVTIITTPIVEYRDGLPCPVCDRPRVFRTVGTETICGSGEDSGRAMKETEPCWTCREAEEVADQDRDQE